MILDSFITFNPSACKTVLLDTALPDEIGPFCEDLDICLCGELLKCFGDEGLIFGLSVIEDTDAERLPVWLAMFCSLPLLLLS